MQGTELVNLTPPNAHFPQARAVNILSPRCMQTGNPAQLPRQRLQGEPVFLQQLRLV